MPKNRKSRMTCTNKFAKYSFRHTRIPVRIHFQCLYFAHSVHLICKAFQSLKQERKFFKGLSNITLKLKTSKAIESKIQTILFC